MLKIIINSKIVGSKLNNFNLSKISSKNFRDYRNEGRYYADNRYAAPGLSPSPYKPQFSLTEEEKESITFIFNFQ